MNNFWAHMLILTRLVSPCQVSMLESHQAALGFVDGPGFWCAHTHVHTLSPVHTHTLPLSLLYTHTHSSLSPCTHTHTLSLLYTHTHDTHTLSPVHTNTHSCSSPRLPASRAAQSHLGLHGRSAVLTLSSELNHPKCSLS